MCSWRGEVYLICTSFSPTLFNSGSTKVCCNDLNFLMHRSTSNSLSCLTGKDKERADDELASFKPPNFSFQNFQLSEDESLRIT